MTDSFDLPVGTVVNISGKIVWIADTSGLPIETQLYSGERFVKVWISGQAISASVTANVSGQPVRISGETVIANVVTNISGQTVYLASGQNLVQNSGQTIIAKISGETVVASVTTNISGQTVYLASGQNNVQMSGQLVAVSGIVGANVSGNQIRPQWFDPSGNQWLDPWTSASGVHRVLVAISGETVVASVTTNISGQTVYTASGNNNVQISGQLVAVSGTVAASVSGNMVSISGQAVSVSGNVVVASVTTNISGQTVYLASGQNAVQNSGEMMRPQWFDPSGATWLDPWTSASGVHRLLVAISGETVVASVTTNISGQVVYLASGQNNAQISGQLVVVSGIVGANVSGNVVQISGQTIYPVSGEAFQKIFDPSGATWQDAWVSQSGGHRVLVAISGELVLASVSGNMVSVSGQAISISGNIVNTSGQVAIISGQPVLVSGQLVAISGLVATSVSGNALRISGEVVRPEVPVQIRTRDTLLITGGSGGIALSSGDVLRVTVRNIGQSGTVMYVGGSGDYPWVASGQANFPFQSGRGFWLRDGDGITIHTSNMAFVRVVSHTSGERVSYLGEQY